MTNAPPARCRIVLVAPRDLTVETLNAVLAAGDVASIIIPAHDRDVDLFQSQAEPLVKAAQEKGVAAVIAGDLRVATRIGADGVHVEGSPAELADAIEKFQPRLMVGVGGVTTRDQALEMGEAQPDYIFFGRFGFDAKPDPHPRNLNLGEWWAQMIQIPCIVQAGADLESVRDVAATGADFVALDAAIFAEGRDPAAEVARANELLDLHAPRLD